MTGSTHLSSAGAGSIFLFLYLPAYVGRREDEICACCRCVTTAPVAADRYGIDVLLLKKVKYWSLKSAAMAYVFAVHLPLFAAAWPEGVTTVLTVLGLTAKGYGDVVVGRGILVVKALTSVKPHGVCGIGAFTHCTPGAAGAQVLVPARPASV